VNIKGIREIENTAAADSLVLKITNKITAN
jgi:hypothetical protein